ncbi:hypothetical protein HY637_05690 [Candidatus Woesearchaeota archaeon]|nr:hypothetical protein [Candidatus Woesearchaeota archaeon]
MLNIVYYNKQQNTQKPTRLISTFMIAGTPFAQQRVDFSPPCQVRGREIKFSFTLLAKNINNRCASKGGEQNE